MIWDAFLFNDELALLEVRLRTLAGVVDRVLIVEGDRTFTGTPRQSPFADVSAKFSWFPGEIHHVVAPLAADVASPWDREHQQRLAIRNALLERVDPDDLIIAGDVDELPRPSALMRLAGTLERPTRLHMVDCLYWANWFKRQPWRSGPMVFRSPDIDHASLRALLGKPHGHWDGEVEEYVEDAGWHISFLGGPGTVRQKLADYSHQELNDAMHRDSAYLEQCLRYGVHFDGWCTVSPQPMSRLDPELRLLAARHPELFCFDGALPTSAAAWCGWAYARKRAPLPLSVRRFLDDRPRIVVGPLGLPMMALHGARVLAHRIRPIPAPPGPTHRPSTA